MHREPVSRRVDTDLGKYLEDLCQAVEELRLLGAEGEAQDAELTIARVLSDLYGAAEVHP